MSRNIAVLVSNGADCCHENSKQKILIIKATAHNMDKMTL
jgi:hypothetical protein